MYAKKSNQKKRSAGREPALRAGTLRSSARRGTARELAALRHPRLFALAGPAVLGSLKVDWKVKINSKSIHAWRGSTGCSCGL
ncbi:protein of unknown function [Stenotrophomonas maltophilia]|nr:protein of unknown function [Stenotrophomonas maltophilia]